MSTPSNGQVFESKTLKSSALAHLKAYPLVDDITSILKQYTLYQYAIGYLKQVEAFGEPYLFKSSTVISTLGKIDTTLDDVVLTKFDQLFPQITKIKLQDLSPASLYGVFKTHAKSTYDSTTEGLIKRIHSVEDVTRPAVAKRVDPFVSPVNNKFESLIKTYLPEESSDVSVDSKDEFERFINLSSTALTKTKPLLSSTRDQVAQIPTHISDVYKEELSSTNNTSYAIRNTSRKLSSEAIQSLKPIVEPLLTTVENFRASTHTKLNEAIDTTKNNIDGIVAEVRHGIDTGTLNGSSSSGTQVAPAVTASA